MQSPILFEIDLSCCLCFRDCGNGWNFGDLRGTESPCSGDDLKASLGERSYKKGRENALATDAGGKFLESRIFENAGGWSWTR